MALHECPACSGSLVEPCDWGQLAHDHWWFVLRCPDCRSERDVLAARPSVEDFEARLEQAHRLLTDQARWWGRSQMRDWADGFATALRAEAVYPMDF
jgi:hypothetical protein